MFLNWLQEQLNSVTEEDMKQFAPAPIESEGPLKVIRPLSEEEKKLFVVLSKISKEKHTLAEDHLASHLSGQCLPAKCNEDYKKLKDLDSKTELINGIMRQSIYMATDSQNIMMIDAGWQLVESPDEEDSNMTISIIVGSFPPY